MEIIDGRKLSTETLLKIKHTAMRLCKSGKNFSEVARILKVHNTSIGKWRKQYQKYGDNGLLPKKKDVSVWINSKLNSEQINILRKMIIKNTPDQMNLEFSLWTRKAIQILIYQMWKIKVCLVTVGRYMKKLGFTIQKPIRRAYEQNPKNVKKWLNKTYPEIVKKAMNKGAEIHWLDETKLSSYSNYLRGFSPKGKTLLVRMKSKRMSFNIISSISKLGKMRFMIYEGSLNIKTLTEFTNRLVKSVHKKLFIIMDKLRSHFINPFFNNGIVQASF